MSYGYSWQVYQDTQPNPTGNCYNPYHYWLFLQVSKSPKIKVISGWFLIHNNLIALIWIKSQHFFLSVGLYFYFEHFQLVLFITVNMLWTCRCSFSLMSLKRFLISHFSLTKYVEVNPWIIQGLCKRYVYLSSKKTKAKKGSCHVWSLKYV